MEGSSEIRLEDAPQRVRDVFNRGFAAFERGNLDYAIELLSGCVEQEPRLLNARRYLRGAQIQKRKKLGSSLLTPLVAPIKALPLKTKISVTRRKDPLAALVLCERLMALDPLAPANVLLFADVAMDAELSDVAIQTLEIAREHRPQDAKLLQALGNLYAAVDMTAEARECFGKLTELKPHDPDIVKAYKDAMARESMVRDGWLKAQDEGGTFRDAVKDLEESTSLEQESKSRHSGAELDGLIEDMRAKLEAEPENLNYHRALARLYAEKQDFDMAIEILEQARRGNRSGDPELDAVLSRMQIAKLDFAIEQARSAGDEVQARTLETTKREFVLQDLEARVAKYPSDAHLRYALGCAYFDEARTTEAIKELQVAQRSPKHRIMAKFYLGLAFRQKGQFDLAVDQLRTAVDEQVGMDETRKTVLYELGDLLESQGDAAGALECFKRIYQVDIGYRDVADRVEQAS